MKKDLIDRLITLAYLEGKITTRGAYEKSVSKKEPTRLVSASTRERLSRRLEAALEGRGSIEDVPLTVGAFLRNVRAEHSLRTQEIFLRLGLSQNIYRMLEQDRISPLKIPVEAWKRFAQLFNLTSEVLVEMVRRTHQLVFYRPSFRTTLARYDARKQKGVKSSTLEKAATELYTKAKLTLPPDEEEKLDALLKQLS